MKYKGIELTPKILLAMTIYIIWHVGPLALIAFGGMLYSMTIVDRWQFFWFVLMLLGMVLAVAKITMPRSENDLENEEEEAVN